MLKDMDSYHLRENIKKQLLDTGLDAVKTTSKKVIHKSDDKIVKQEPVEEIIIPSEKRDEIFKKLRQVIIKMEHNKVSELLNDSTISKFVTKNGSK